MANSPQAIKRARQALKRELHNASQRSTLRTAVKKALKLIQSKGFSLWSVDRGFSNKKNGKTLQLDLCFFK